MQTVRDGKNSCLCEYQMSTSGGETSCSLAHSVDVSVSQHTGAYSIHAHAHRVGIADWLIYLRKRKALRKNPGRLSMLSVSIPSCDAPRLSDATI